MQVVGDWRELPDALKGAAVAVGAFDGVHRGHQAVIASAREAAERLGAPLGVVSFDPHPRRWFQKDAAPFRLMTADQMGEALPPLGVDILYLLPFDAEMAGMTDAAFAERVLADGLGVRHAAVGFDFTFGKGRSGSPEALRAYGERLGFTVSVVDRLDDADGLKLSSSAVREALKAGDMARAAAILGRPFAIRGTVIHGDKRGRTIGVPTANIELNGYMRPAYGVYATRTRLQDGRVINGVASLGVRPTVEDGGRQLLEVFCLQWPAALGRDGGYGRCVRVELLHKLHDERKYPSLQALRAGIERDIADAQAWFDAQTPAR